MVTPDTVKRERFGGIAGRVRETSAFPVTREGVLAVVGNAEVTGRLLAEGPCIEATVELEADDSTESGFKWTSSRGPALKISPGTTVSARVTVEERAPITYLLPFLRAASGVY
jgi:HlyD family secretion protein